MHIMSSMSRCFGDEMHELLASIKYGYEIISVEYQNLSMNEGIAE